MPPESINLLPTERRRALRLDYFLRLGTVAAVLATALVLVALVLLLPTYVFLASAQTTREARLASAEADLSSGDQVELVTRLDSLTTDAATLIKLAKAPSVSVLMRTTLAVAHTGVAVTGVSYTPQSGTKPGTLAITGTAITRDDLRAYQLALIATPIFSGADLPVSSYAKDRNIPFTITATLAVPAP